MNQEEPKDTLKQLEKLLKDDIKANTENKQGLTRKDINGILIRVAVSLVLILVIHFSGLIQTPNFIPFAILVIVMMEVYLFWKERREKKQES